MVITLYKNDFISEMKKIRPDKFSQEALEALFDYYTNLEEDLGKEIEFDPTSISLEWTEYENVDEALSNYGLSTLEELQDHTTVIELKGGGLLVQAF